ncbi:MAG: HAMP domain-containing sensor histidine kinase [Pseudomonadota bacterium]
MKFLRTLSGRFLVLTAIFVMIAEILIFVPSVARFREEFLNMKLERSQIASLALLASDDISDELREELLINAGVFNVVLRRDEARQLMLSAPMPAPIATTFDLRDPPATILIRDALSRLTNPEPEVIRVIGQPGQMGGLLIEITLETTELRAAMLDYGVRILILSAVISIVTAGLLFIAVRALLVKPIKHVVGTMAAYADAPEDARFLIAPSAGVTELREAEEALLSMQTQLTGAMKQRERLAQLGGAVAKVSQDLRNILTSAQLFTDRIEMSEDPQVKRMAPKLVNSITRAVHLCESTLAFGKAEEPAPRLSMIDLDDLVQDVIDAERLAVGEANVSFAADVPVAQPVLADGEQLHRVISNITRNARQAIIATGRPGEISISASDDPSHHVITITDTGPGLPMKAQEHLFEAFQGGTTKGGTGLGLSIARELLRGHGGDLCLGYTGESGTQFVITLPLGNADH